MNTVAVYVAPEPDGRNYGGFSSARVDPPRTTALVSAGFFDPVKWRKLSAI